MTKRKSNTNTTYKITEGGTQQSNKQLQLRHQGPTKLGGKIRKDTNDSAQDIQVGKSMGKNDDNQN